MGFFKDKVTVFIIVCLLLAFSLDVFLKKEKVETTSTYPKTTKVMPRVSVLPVMPPIVIEIPKEKGKA